MSVTRSLRGLVITPYGPEYGAARATVRAALAESGVEPVLLDDTVGSSWAYDVPKAIESSDLIVADVSSANPNVLYELGYAHALRKPTLLLVNSVHTGNIPIDISSYQMATYDPSDPQTLKRQIASFLEYQTSRLG